MSKRKAPDTLPAQDWPIVDVSDWGIVDVGDWVIPDFAQDWPVIDWPLDWVQW